MKYTLKFLFVTFLTCLILCSCVGKKEINQLGIVSATAIDYDSESREFVITAAVITPVSASAGKKEGDTGGTGIWIATERGKTFLDATRNLRLRSPLALMWNHCKVYVIGKNAASEVLHEIIDTFARHRDLKYSSWLLLTPENASDILKVKTEVSKDISTEILGMVDTLQEHGRSYTLNIKDFLANMSDIHSDSMLGRIITVPKDTMDNQEGGGKQTGDSKTIILEGMGVIKNGKLAGWLNADETRAFLLATGKLKRDIVPIIYEDSKISVEISKVKTKIDPVIENKRLIFNIRINYIGNILGMSLKENTKFLGRIDIIENLLENTTKEDVLSTIRKVQEQYNADIFDFKGAVYRKYPNYFKSIQDKWYDLYKDADFNVSVDATIDETGDIAEPIMKESK